MYFLTPYFIIFGVVPTIFFSYLTIIVCFLLTPWKKLSNGFAHFIARGWGRYLLFILFVRVKVCGKKNYNPKKRYIVAINHSTYMDTFFVFYILRKEYRLFSADFMFKIPFTGSVMKRAGYIPVKKDPHNNALSIKKAVENLKDNISVALFPEGRRIDMKKIAPLKKGVLQISQMCPDAPILPIVIGGSEKVRKIKRFNPSLGLNVYVQILEPFYMRDIDGDDNAKLEYLRDIFQKASDDLMEKYGGK